MKSDSSLVACWTEFLRDLCFTKGSLSSGQTHLLENTAVRSPAITRKLSSVIETNLIHNNLNQNRSPELQVWVGMFIPGTITVTWPIGLKPGGHQSQDICLWGYLWDISITTLKVIWQWVQSSPHESCSQSGRPSPLHHKYLVVTSCVLWI
jgi:hypothetical protein